LDAGHPEKVTRSGGLAIDRGAIVVWFETDEVPAVDPDGILVAGAGLVESVRVSGPHRSGREALAASEVAAWLGRPAATSGRGRRSPAPPASGARRTDAIRRQVHAPLVINIQLT